MSTESTVRFQLRDLPLPVRLVLSTFLVSVGLGYFWGMAQIHFKHSSGGEPMPGVKDIVAHFSGVPWPTVPKVDETPEPAEAKATAKVDGPKVPGVKIKTIIDTRCAICHSKDGEKDDVLLSTYAEIEKFLAKNNSFPKGQMHAVVTGSRDAWNKKNMVKAFFEKSDDWKDQVKALTQPVLEKQRVAEQLSVVAWLEAGAPEAAYTADAFPLDGKLIVPLAENLRTEAVALPKDAPTATTTAKKVDPWKEAKSKQLSIEALTQSTHAHLLSFSMLWALTGLIFAFSSYPTLIKCLLSPIVLIAQVGDIACWWLARLDGVGPYFAMAIMGTGAIVGLGLASQIVLSLFNMYSPRGKLVVFVVMVISTIGFGVVALKVVKPHLDEERTAAEARG